jgi:hypothetical protein
MSIKWKIVVSSPDGRFFSKEGFLSPKDRFTQNLNDARMFDSTWEAFESVMDTAGSWDVASTIFCVTPRVVEINSESRSDRSLSSTQYLGESFFYDDSDSSYGIMILEHDYSELSERAFIPRTECDLIEQGKPIAELKKDPEWVREFIKKHLDEDI